MDFELMAQPIELSARHMLPQHYDAYNTNDHVEANADESKNQDGRGEQHVIRETSFDMGSLPSSE